MKLRSAEILRLLPLFMRDDAAIRGLADGTDELVRSAADSTRLLSRWDNIDELPEAALDELAWELNILWYDSMSDIDVKRRVVKESDMVYATLGTKYAVETMMSAFYGDIWVEEWWEYGGMPHHFKLVTTNPDVLENPERFYFLLNTAKRLSAWFDGVTVGLTGNMTAYAGQAVNEHSHETYLML